MHRRSRAGKQRQRGPSGDAHRRDAGGHVVAFSRFTPQSLEGLLRVPLEDSIVVTVSIADAPGLHARALISHVLSPCPWPVSRPFSWPRTALKRAVNSTRPAAKGTQTGMHRHREHGSVPVGFAIRVPWTSPVRRYTSCRRNGCRATAASVRRPDNRTVHIGLFADERRTANRYPRTAGTKCGALPLNVDGWRPPFRSMDASSSAGLGLHSRNP